MAKPLLILMLVATQLLAGSGGSVHLCVKGDGSYCCIDADPASCTCCRNQEEPRNSCGDLGLVELGKGCTSGCCGPQRPPEPAEEERPEALSGGTCSCTHVPLVVSSEPQSTPVRSEATASDEQSAVPAVWLAASLVRNAFIAPSPPLDWWSRQAEIPCYALTVVSTVVIRC